MGSKKRPFYRLIATDSRMPRDGRFLETLGFYDPIRQPAEVRVDEVLVFKWFERGAIPTTSARSLLRQLGYLQKWELMKQGVVGDELDARVEAIRTQQEKAASLRESRKKGLPSEKAKAKRAAATQAEATKATDEQKPEEAKAPAESAASEETATQEEATPEKAAAEKAAPDKAAADKAAADKAAPDKAAPEETAPEKAAPEKAAEKPGADTPASKEEAAPTGDTTPAAPAEESNASDSEESKE